MKFDAIASHEWHPFTIANAPNSVIHSYDGTKVLIFFIKATGRWTEALYNYASAFDLSKATKSTEMSIRGHYGAPIVNFCEYNHIILIGAGVGVTPLLSVWQYLVEKGCSIIQADHNKPPTLESQEKDHEGKTSKISLLFLKMEHVFESLTASICLLFIFVTGETIVTTTLIFGYYWEAYLLGKVLANISVIFHSGSIFVSILAGGGSIQYFRRFKCWIEVAISLVDAVNLLIWSQIGAKTTSDHQAVNVATIMGLAAITVFLHTIRILHVFYATLNPTSTSNKTQLQNQLSSVQGIFVNTSYSGMRFTFEQLLRPIEEGLSEAFSLRFYGTREMYTKSFRRNLKSGVRNHMRNSRHIIEHEIEGEANKNNFFCFQEGRPDWQSIFRKAILKAHFSCRGGDCVGVFFCGNPALSKILNAEAARVTGQHRHSVKMSGRRTCNCKIVVHTENY